MENNPLSQNTATAVSVKPEINDEIKSVPSYAKILISARSESASVIVMPPVGAGAEMSLEQLNEAVAAAGVCYGVRREVLAQIIESKLYNIEFDIAEYTPPTPGKNGSISYRFERVPTALLIENEEGNVNYRELGLFKSVLKDTVIADITPPEEGIHGMDVLGRDIAPKPVSKAAFSTGVGTVLSEDGLRIIAAIDGVINFEKTAFVVRHDLNIKADIDYNTGNIKFLGNINISGNVGEGFKVESTGGNVVIYGAVFSGAEITAAGSITLKQVCNHASVKAGGDINATFCEYCSLSADGDITAQTLIVSTVFCNGTLACKGGLVGGNYTVLSGAIINGNVGAPHYPQTEIILGNNALLTEERDKLCSAIAKGEQEIIDLSMIVDYLNTKKREEFTITEEKEHMLGASVRSRIRKSRAVAEAKKRIEEIEHLLENVQELRMTVGGTVYGKTRFCINTAKCVVKDDLKNVSIYVDKENGFHFDNM
jgi:uncharacterized protein (DUF342 family)